MILSKSEGFALAQTFTSTWGVLLRSEPPYRKEGLRMRFDIPTVAWGQDRIGGVQSLGKPDQNVLGWRLDLVVFDERVRIGNASTGGRFLGHPEMKDTVGEGVLTRHPAGKRVIVLEQPSYIADADPTRGTVSQEL
jgi:hypothetical protein